jgi:AcrR family transcriptional regulator
MARMTADARRADIVRIAIEQFAVGGYNGTSTEAIAAEAGISQPYLFRLFKTKRELFLACCTASHEAVVETFERAADGVAPDERFRAMGQAYIEMLQDRRLLLFQMQSFAACSDPVVQAHVREEYLQTLAAVKRLTDAEEEQIWSFFGQGMLLNVVASLDLPVSDVKSIPGHGG